MENPNIQFKENSADQQTCVQPKTKPRGVATKVKQFLKSSCLCLLGSCIYEYRRQVDEEIARASTNNQADGNCRQTYRSEGQEKPYAHTIAGRDEYSIEAIHTSSCRKRNLSDVGSSENGSRLRTWALGSGLNPYESSLSNNLRCETSPSPALRNIKSLVKDAIHKIDKYEIGTISYCESVSVTEGLSYLEDDGSCETKGSSD